MPALSDSQREALMAELGGLRRFCYSLTGDGADADDLLQATVEKLLQKGIPVFAIAFSGVGCHELQGQGQR